jgi:hypothetical protein
VTFLGHPHLCQVTFITALNCQKTQSLGFCLTKVSGGAQLEVGALASQKLRWGDQAPFTFTTGLMECLGTLRLLQNSQYYHRGTKLSLFDYTIVYHQKIVPSENLLSSVGYLLL